MSEQTEKIIEKFQTIIRDDLAALEFWQEHGGFEAIFVTETGEVVATEGADACFAFEGRDNDFTYRMVKR